MEGKKITSQELKDALNADIDRLLEQVALWINSWLFFR